MRKGREHDVQERQERSWSQMEIQQEVSRSCFNSPIFLVPKPHGHGMRAVLDFREVNAASVPDRYTIREV